MPKPPPTTSQPPVSDIITLGEEKILVLKLDDSPSGKWDLDIDIRPKDEEIGGGGCNKASCTKCTQCSLTVQV
jgi:hypothetical protein